MKFKIIFALSTIMFCNAYGMDAEMAEAVARIEKENKEEDAQKAQQLQEVVIIPDTEEAQKALQALHLDQHTKRTPVEKTSTKNKEEMDDEMAEAVDRGEKENEEEGAQKAHKSDQSAMTAIFEETMRPLRLHIDPRIIREENIAVEINAWIDKEIAKPSPGEDETQGDLMRSFYLQRGLGNIWLGARPDRNYVAKTHIGFNGKRKHTIEVVLSEVADPQRCFEVSPCGKWLPKYTTIGFAQVASEADASFVYDPKKPHNERNYFSVEMDGNNTITVSDEMTGHIIAQYDANEMILKWETRKYGLIHLMKRKTIKDEELELLETLWKGLGCDRSAHVKRDDAIDAEILEKLKGIGYRIRKMSPCLGSGKGLWIDNPRLDLVKR